MRKTNFHKMLQGIILLLVGTETLQDVREVFFTKDTCNESSHTYFDDYHVISNDTRSTLHCAILSAASDCKSFFYQQNTLTCSCAIIYTNNVVSNTTDVFQYYLLDEYTNYYLSEETRPKPCNDTQYTWIPEMKTCIRVSTYGAFYSDACITNDAHLLDLSSFSKSRALNRYLFCSGYRSDFWIGISDQHVEGKYMWLNNSLVTYTNWAPNYPMIAFFPDEDCGLVSYNATDKHFYWKIKSCNFGYEQFICEKP